jgi:uncharacterized damage-inducible protein DinB/predicted RNase H-like HicB family nuclease
MATYDLSLETGPQRKKSLVHVLALLGCVAEGKTADEAVAAAPEAIRAYLRYLSRHGERVNMDANIDVRVADENLAGLFSGQAMWPADRKPLAPKDLARYVRWLEWSREDLLALVNEIDEKRFRTKPASGRSLREILLHVLDADKAYVYGLVGVFKAMGDPTNAALKGQLDLRVALANSREVAVERLAKLTPQERAKVRTAGKSLVSAHRMIRRMLEHEWEHRREIAARLGKEA